MEVPERSPGAGGRPDERYPELVAVRQEAGVGGVLVSVVANVNLTTGEGSIAYVHPVSGLAPTPPAPESGAAVRAVGEGGAVLAEFPVAVKLDSELEKGEDRHGIVDTVLPVPAGTRALELAVGGRVADTFRAGGPPPVVRALRPAMAAGDLRVGVQFDRDMEQSHTYAVQVSADRGQSWQTVGVGLRQPQAAVDAGGMREGQEVQVRVIVTNGLVAHVVTGPALRLGGTARPG